ARSSPVIASRVAPAVAPAARRFEGGAGPNAQVLAGVHSGVRRDARSSSSHGVNSARLCRGPLSPQSMDPKRPPRLGLWPARFAPTLSLPGDAGRPSTFGRGCVQLYPEELDCIAHDEI